ncbi:MAG: PAS domain-containing protein [Acidobacteriota bacterium]
MIFREELILYPAAEESLDKRLWNEMHRESFEIGFSYINTSVEHKKFGDSVTSGMNEGVVDLGTGKLTPEQIIMIFNTLPVDITFVDENNRVAYFSSPKERIFTRSKAVIGREVQNCHPPESLDTVNKIIDSFREGKRDRENFWININGNTILIQYYAVRNDNGEYKGTLEVSSNISDIRKIGGEKRLLDY